MFEKELLLFKFLEMTTVREKINQTNSFRLMNVEVTTNIYSS